MGAQIQFDSIHVRSLPEGQKIGPNDVVAELGGSFFTASTAFDAALIASHAGNPDSSGVQLAREFLADGKLTAAPADVLAELVTSKA